MAAFWQGSPSFEVHPEGRVVWKNVSFFSGQQVSRWAEGSEGGVGLEEADPWRSV
jgi:hypothetical protein